MIEPNEVEIAAMGHASDMGGEYLESIRKTDLTSMTEREWSTFISCVCSGYVESLMKARHFACEAAGKVEGLPV